MGMFPLIYLYLIYCLAFIYCYFYYYIFIYYCHFNFSFISTNVLPLYSSYALFVNPSLREGWFLWILWLLFTPRHSQSLLRKDLPPLRGSLLLPMRLQGALLIGCVYKTQCSYSWRSRPAFLQADFHARQKGPQECFLFTWKYDKMQGSNGLKTLHFQPKILNFMRRIKDWRYWN